MNFYSFIKVLLINRSITSFFSPVTVTDSPPRHVAFLYLNSLAKTLPGIFSVSAKLLLNPEQLVVFGETLRPAGSPSFNLTSAQTNHEVSNKAILGLTRPVGDHSAPPFSLGHVVGLDGLSDRPDLVNLQEEPVASFLFDCRHNPLRICHQEIISDNLNLGL